MYARQLIVEAFVVGLVLAVVGSFISMESMTSRFLVGVAIHLGFEALLFNKWYCKRGAACRNL